MENFGRFNENELEERLDLNYSFVTETARNLNRLKGYDVAYSTPKKGKMIVNYEGQNYIVDVEPIVPKNGEPMSLADAMKEYGFIFN